MPVIPALRSLDRRIKTSLTHIARLSQGRRCLHHPPLSLVSRQRPGRPARAPATMFRRKLTALDYHNPVGFNCKDETEFRNFIVWLEDQKIRHCKIEDRGNLRNIHSSDWPKFFEKYLRDVNCPFKIQERQEAIDWLLGLAVRLEIWR